MKNTVMTTQVEHLTMQVSASRTMIIEDNQALARASYPPVGKFHQTTVVKTRGNEHTRTLTHYSPSFLAERCKEIYLSKAYRRIEEPYLDRYANIQPTSGNATPTLKDFFAAALQESEQNRPLQYRPAEDPSNQDSHSP